MSEFNRRDFLKKTGVLAASAPFLRLIAGNNTKSASDPIYEWIRASRILLAEGYNAPFYPSYRYQPEKAVQIARAINADAIRFPGAGYYAFFPTKSGFPVHPELKGDPLGETVERCHAEGLKSVVYVPLNHAFMDVRSRNPMYADWTKKFADGSPMETKHFGNGPFYEGCLNSPLREVYKHMVRELLTQYRPDVLYFDGPYQGMDNGGVYCHCPYCRAAYQAKFGLEIPDQAAAGRDEIVRYVNWMRSEVVTGWMRGVRETIQAVRDVPMLFNDTALLSRRDWRSHAVPETDGFMFESADSPEGKLFAVSLGQSTGKVVWTYVGGYGLYNHRHLKDAHNFGWYSYPLGGQELLIDGAAAIAAGAGMVYWGLSRLYFVTGGPLACDAGRYIKELFDFQKANDAFLRGLRSQPQVGVLVSSQTIDWYDSAHFVPAAFESYPRGAYQLLKANSFEPEPFLDWEMSPEKIARYRMIWASNAVCLSDAQCAMLADYVNGGGCLIATHLTSVADELGHIRGNFKLAALFGATLLDSEPTEEPDVYLRLPNGEELPQDPQFVSFRVNDAEVLAETVSRGTGQTLGPAIVSRTAGSGRVIYVGSGLDAIYAETSMVPLRDFFESLVSPWLASTRSYEVPYRVGLVSHLAVSDDSIVLHLLADTGNKNKVSHSLEEFMPMTEVRVRIRIPAGRSVRMASLMRSGAFLPISVNAGWFEATVARVNVHEAVRLDLG